MGNGHRSHILENVDDPNDKLYLCSCGGTGDVNGFCDGTHNKKNELGCHCRYCLLTEERAEKTT